MSFYNFKQNCHTISLQYSALVKLIICQIGEMYLFRLDYCKSVQILLKIWEIDYHTVRLRLRLEDDVRVTLQMQMQEKKTKSNYFYCLIYMCVTLYEVTHRCNLRVSPSCAVFKCIYSLFFIFSGDSVLPSSISSEHRSHVARKQDPCSLGKHHRPRQAHTGQKTTLKSWL